MKEIEVNHVLIVPDNITEDDVWKSFIAWVEANKWETGGGIQEVEKNKLPSRFQVNDEVLFNNNRNGIVEAVLFSENKVYYTINSKGKIFRNVSSLRVAHDLEELDEQTR